MHGHTVPLWSDQVRQEFQCTLGMQCLALYQQNLPGLWCQEGRDELHLETWTSLFPLLLSLSHSKGSRNKIPFACLNLLPQSFLSQMQLMSVPLDMTDSASLECSQSIFFPRMFHPIFFLILCFVPSTHGLFRSPLVLFWYRIFLSLLDLLDVEVDGCQWSHRDILPSCADPRAGIDSNPLQVFRASLTAAEGRNSLWLCDNISEQ